MQESQIPDINKRTKTLMKAEILCQFSVSCLVVFYEEYYSLLEQLNAINEDCFKTTTSLAIDILYFLSSMYK